MQFDVYCDENHPELFTSKKPTAEYLMIGSLWLPTDLKGHIKSTVWDLRKKYNIWGEIKWRKVNNKSLPFYKSLIKLFLGYGNELRFRCIAVSHNQFDKKWHQGDVELGFYKFYYQLLHHWISDFNDYRIFCDIKSNRDLSRLKKLGDCLNNANLSSNIKQIQALPSRQVVLIQLADLFLGMASARLNNTITEKTAKYELVSHFENVLGRQLVESYKSENKFNIFKINLGGGW